jgi:hypothetical protein
MREEILFSLIQAMYKFRLTGNGHRHGSNKVRAEDDVVVIKESDELYVEMYISYLFLSGKSG